jgi:hypothetical protein
MLNIFILEVIDTFENSELESFKNFLGSAYFNTGPNATSLVVLFDKLAEAKRGSTLENLNKDLIFQEVFPNTPFIQGKLDKLGTELKKLLQLFLILERYKSDALESRRELDLLAALRLRGLSKRYFLELEKMKKRIYDAPIDTLENIELQFDLAFEEYHWEQHFNKVKGDLTVPNVLKYLDKYYVNTSIWLQNVLLLQQKVVALPEASNRSFFKTDNFPLNPDEVDIFLKISKKIHELLELDVPEFAQFEELVALLQSNSEKIGKEDLAGFYSHLRNFCTFLIERGHYHLRPILHQIHIENLEKGYFYYNGEIPPNAFLNITTTALNVNALEWAKAFIEKHKGRITGENETQDFYSMNKAICLFAEKRWEDALDIIPFGSSYSFYHLLARRLELKIYYELDSDLLPYKIDAFKMFISRAGRNLLSSTLHDLHTNFINFLRQLSLSPKTRDKSRASKMIERINEKKLVADRAWLLEKARELGERKT